MEDTNTTATESTPVTDGTTVDSGQAPASTDNGGEPQDNSAAKSEPSGEGDFGGFKTPEEAVKAYKELQREFGKRNESYKTMEARFEKFGGAEKVAEFGEYLSNNPRFTEWFQKEQMAHTIGDINLDELDEDTRKSIELVQKIANSVADVKIKEALASQVKPLADAHRDTIINDHFKKMDDKYGKVGVNWREFTDDIISESFNLSPSKRNNPSVEDIEGLFWSVVAKKGKLEEVSAKYYSKVLESKKSKSTGTKPPTGAAPQQFKQAKTIEEAFAIAKQKQSA